MMGKKLNKNIISIASVSVLVLLAVNGCKKQESSAPTPLPAAQPLAQTAVQKTATSAKKVLPVQNIHSSNSKPVGKVTLDFSNRKDPFKPAIVEMSQVAKSGGKDLMLNMNLLPIQRVEVEKFKITGIIAGLKENRALLVDPDGKAYVAKSGMLIGPNNGKITRITANTLEVDESFKDEAGRIRKRTVKLTLQRKR